MPCTDAPVVLPSHWLARANLCFVVTRELKFGFQLHGLYACMPHPSHVQVTPTHGKEPRISIAMNGRPIPGTWEWLGEHSAVECDPRSLALVLSKIFWGLKASAAYLLPSPAFNSVHGATSVHVEAELMKGP